ncbi:hypothetical protein [Methylobacter tundripaludum]|uniref:hypothetical protein n=1 Tax=Methylobacter tundripaludum TaxID=173365 RepID=UPI00126881D4|nr:hypothetical protein [Methylobacter tundripaludum]
MRNYNNNSSDTAIMLILLVVLPCLAVIYWIQDYFGLDIQTSSEVFGRHIIFLISFFIACFFVIKIERRIILILPSSFALYILYCWRPAFSYWARNDFRNIVYDNDISYSWYANGWIQMLIAATIVSGSHWLINYFDNR